jgi:probable HAF family extracellular repeat protein
MRILALLAAALGLANLSGAELRYNVLSADLLTGKSSSFSAMNNSGQVVGSISTGKNGISNTFLYSGGKVTDLGKFGGVSSFPIDINDAGQILGKFQDAGLAWHIFLYSNGVANDLGPMGGGWPKALNNSGDFIGNMLVGNEYHPFLYHAGTVTDLATAIGGTNEVEANDFNDSGAIVGSMRVGKYNHAFIYSGGTTTDLAVQLNLSADSITTANGINNSGQVIFYGQLQGYSDDLQPFLYSGGTFQNLDPIHDLCTPSDINDAGQIIGNYLFNNREYSACIFENGAPVRLKNLTSPSLPYRLYYADEINDMGWILCGDDNNSYLLVPLDPNIPPPSFAPIQKKRIVVSRPRLTFSGKARGKVTCVSYRIGSRVYRIAEGTNNWRFSIGLKGIKRTSLTLVAHGPGGDSEPLRIPVLVK